METLTRAGRTTSDGPTLLPGSGLEGSGLSDFPTASGRTDGPPLVFDTEEDSSESLISLPLPSLRPVPSDSFPEAVAFPDEEPASPEAGETVTTW